MWLETPSFISPPPLPPPINIISYTVHSLIIIIIHACFAIVGLLLYKMVSKKLVLSSPDYLNRF